MGLKSPFPSAVHDGAAWPIKNGVAKFRGELEDYIRTHQSSLAKVTPLQEKIAHGTRADADPLLVLSGTPSGAVAALRSPGPYPA